MMSGPLAIGADAPDFEAQTTEGPIRFHDWLGNSWGVIFSHPKDFTPVCTTELGYMARIKPEFDKRGVKIIGLSIDPVDKHAGWASDTPKRASFRAGNVKSGRAVSGGASKAAWSRVESCRSAKTST